VFPSDVLPRWRRQVPLCPSRRGSHLCHASVVQATASASESLQLFTNRYVGGVDNYLQVITAQTALLTNQRNDIDIERRRMDASVLLVKAVGGGWNISQLPSF
jgi:outer membrane protein TolC